MSVKITIGESKTQEVKPFPKLMTVNDSTNDDNGIVILFTEGGNGTVIKAAGKYHIGYSSFSFYMEQFTDFNEPITLQNS
jgi:hypothetical protein